MIGLGSDKNDLILDCVDLRLPLRKEEIAGVVEEWGVRVVQEQKWEVLLTATFELDLSNKFQS